MYLRQSANKFLSALPKAFLKGFFACGRMYLAGSPPKKALKERAMRMKKPSDRRHVRWRAFDPNARSIDSVLQELDEILWISGPVPVGLKLSTRALQSELALAGVAMRRRSWPNPAAMCAVWLGPLAPKPDRLRDRGHP
jgi:hypothetical protein